MSEWHQGFVAGAVLVPLGIALVLALVAATPIVAKAAVDGVSGLLFRIAVQTGFFMPFALWRALSYNTLFAGRLFLLRGEQWPQGRVGVVARVARTYRGARVFLHYCRQAYLGGEKDPWKISEAGKKEARSVRLGR